MRNTPNDFYLDNLWSVARDKDIAKYLSIKSPDANIIIVNDASLQRAGIDLIQLRGDGNRDLIDTVHDKNYLSENLCLEWISNTTVTPAVPGKFNPDRKDTLTTWVFYFFWTEHAGEWLPTKCCRFSFPEMVTWLGFFRYCYPKHFEKDRNKTQSFLVPIEVLEEKLTHFDVWKGLLTEYTALMEKATVQ